MRLLCFQARSFSWRSFKRSLDEVGGVALDAVDVSDELRDCVVVFAHAEQADEGDAPRKRAFQQALKHVKWLCNKRAIKRVVLHSFTHLGAVSADPAFASEFLEELAARLGSGGYHVKLTPFGHLCEWNIDVYGESLAKVYKQI
ncbi:MAG: threonyl-tRNA synthetase editing domain-containing protein [Planctomycetota bacterium]|nr:threonyl-tRNA synthetase editing domain-containing protein [Planctomycetota bacterium]